MSRREHHVTEISEAEAGRIERAAEILDQEQHLRALSLRGVPSFVHHPPFDSRHEPGGDLFQL